MTRLRRQVAELRDEVEARRRMGTLPTPTLTLEERRARLLRIIEALRAKAAHREALIAAGEPVEPEPPLTAEDEERMAKLQAVLERIRTRVRSEGAEILT